MAFDFPASPTAGQVYTDAVTGIVYTFDGVVWVAGSGGVQATSPNPRSISRFTAN